MKKLIGIIIILALLGLLGWRIYQRIQEASASKTPTRQPTAAGSPQGQGSRPGGGTFGKQAVAVEVAPVKQQTLQEMGQYTGSLSPQSQFVVTANVSGRLERLLVNIGDRVKQNQVIATIDAELFQQQVERAQADLDVAKANLTEAESTLFAAQREFERSKTLSQGNILSQSKLDAAEAEYNAAEARVKVAQANVASRESALKTAQLNLSYTSVKATWSGDKGERVIAERFASEGALLKANDQIVSVVDIRSIICVINVIERDYFRIKPGQQASVTTDAFPGQIFDGRVARIAPILKETSRQAAIEIDIPNPNELLKPGMFARVQLQFDEIPNATVVPVAALVRRNEQQGVFVVDEQQMSAKFVPVTVGVTNAEVAQILAPPLSGIVVTLGQHLLEDGSSLTLPQQQTPDGERRQRPEERR
ncbi:efflux transporter, RND family, MFP subunit [Candidatus Moduliflexus flocculans]|uniref:Efflux transporter, RND family, MFP subunit n=1 Tax=Candidatus Moduliflexus flocculans TaxID=1499966 RepID=A0A0S6W4A7_9BACT|nr:efflux transporter, RND family, MFP subunit [Candidatus Moduliflexus flocculans]